MKLEVNRLKTLAHSNPTAESVFLAFAGRERIRHFTDLQRFRFNLLRQGIKVVDNDYYSVFKQLQELGIGHLIPGRKGSPSRFIWNYSLLDIAKMGIEGKELETKKLEVAPAKKEKRVLKVLSKEEPKPQLGNKILFISLRKDVNVEIVIPIDIERDEVDTICTAIKRSFRTA